MEDNRRPEFSWIEGMAISLAMIGVQLSSEVLNQWGFYFYSPSEGVGRTIYVAIKFVWIIFFIGTLWDAVTDPLIGSWSDKTKTTPGVFRYFRMRGRRRPFIFYGSILLMLPAIAFWFPPVEETSMANLAYGTILLCLHWTMFTIVYIPLNALAPEIARSERARISMGTYVAVGMILGLAMAAVLPGELIVWLDPARTEDSFSAMGYRRLAASMAVLSLLLFQLPVWLVRERYDSESAPRQHAPVLRSYLDACRNRAFVVYALAFFCFTSGFLAAQRALPYWAELGLGGDEGTVTILMLPFILTALLSLAVIPALARRLHVKWMIILAFFIIATGLPCMYLIGAANVTSSTKVVLGALLFAYCGIGQGIMYVMITPILGEAIDYDEQRSGERREALYNGLSGFTWKASMGTAIAIASMSMHTWGNSPEHGTGVLLVGPIAGVFAVLGLASMLFYPKLHLTRQDKP